jgi:hypothetical protein
VRIFIRSFTLAVIAACATVAVATAATPKPGGTYVGSSASHHPLRIKMAHNGKTGILSFCGYNVKIHIVGNHFGVRITTAGGLVSVLRLHGAWMTRRLVQGHIDLNFASNCNGLPGPWSATLT